MTAEHLSKEKLQRHYDGDLSGTDAADVQQHLRTCAQCEAELASFERLGDMLRWSTDDATTAAEVDFNQMFASIEQAVEHERESNANADPSGKVVPLRSRRSRSRVLPSLGAVALAAAAVLMLTRRDKIPNDAPAADQLAMLDDSNKVEVVAFKPGTNAGQLFPVHLSERETATVLWLDDDYDDDDEPEEQQRSEEE